MKKKSLIKSRAATKKALVATRKKGQSLAGKAVSGGLSNTASSSSLSNTASSSSLSNSSVN